MAQNAFLTLMQGCRSRVELEAPPQLVATYRARVQQLHEGRVPPQALAITQQVSQEAHAYRSNAAVALCLRHLAARGIRIPPGEVVRYVIVDRQHRDPARRYLPEPFLDALVTYDASAYEGLLRDAFHEVCIHVCGAHIVWTPHQHSLLSPTGA